MLTDLQVCRIWTFNTIVFAATFAMSPSFLAAGAILGSLTAALQTYRLHLTEKMRMLD